MYVHMYRNRRINVLLYIRTSLYMSHVDERASFHQPHLDPNSDAQRLHYKLMSHGYLNPPWLDGGGGITDMFRLLIRFTS